MQNSLISTTDLTTLLQSNHLVCSASVTFTLKDSTQYTITADNIIKYGIQTDLMESNKISLGGCVPSVGDIEVISSAITFNTKQVAYYTIYYSILMPNNVTQAVPLGTFYPDNISVNGLTTVFKGYDILKKFDKVFKESQVNRATVTSLYTRFTQACTICGISSPTITVDDNPDGDASYIFNTLTGYCMPQQDFDTYRSYVGCIAAACGCSVAAGREPNTLRLVSIFRQSDSNVDYTFSDSFVSISESWARSVLFTEIRFRNYSKLATGTRIDDYDIESLVADDSIEKMYKYGKNPFIEPQAMWDELDGRRCYIRARNRIRSQFGNSYEFFNLEIAPIPAFDTGDTLKILGADGSWHWIYISGWTFDGLTLTLNFGDPGSGASATSTGGAGLGYATAGGQTSQALNTLEDEITVDTKVVKEKTRKLKNGTYRKFNYEYDVNFNKKAEDFLDSERIDVLSSRWLHAEKRLDVSPYETTGCKYNIEFPAVIYTTARHQNSKYMVEMRASANGVIPCTVSGTLNTEARIVGYIDSCTQYACLDTSWDYGYSKWYRNENHIHAVQKMAKFKMLDANGNTYGISSLENLKIKFDNNSKFKSGGWGGNNGLLKAVKKLTSFDETATNNAVDDIGEYLQKASIYTDIPEECITKASSATVESNPGGIFAFDRHLDSIEFPEYISLCDSTLAHLGNYSLSGTAEDVLTLVNDDGYWEIPANHFEYRYFMAVKHKVQNPTPPPPFTERYVDIFLHIVQPEVYIDIGKSLSDIMNKIYIDFGYIDKDDGWYSRNSSLAQPYWYNFTPKWSIAPYSNGHEDTWDSSHEIGMENEAVRGEYLSAIRKFRNPKTGYPIYLAQTSGGDFKLYENDTRYQTEYDEAVAMMEGDITVYTNLFDDTEESFISGKWNSSENIADGSNSIIGSYNYIDGQNNNVDSGYTVIGSLNNIAGFAEHEKGEPDCNILIGSNNTLKDFKGLAFLNANYGFIVDSLNDDIWVYFGRTEKYSMRLIFKKFLNVITLITRNGTALTINDGVVDISVPEALSELTDDETHRLVTDTEKATWNAKQDALVWDSVPTENSLHPVTSGGIYAYAGNYYTKTEVDNLLEMAMLGMFIPVTTLPEPSADTMKGIYLVPSTSGRSEDNIRDEYITIALRQGGKTTYQWELIGTTRVDLTGYVKKITIGDTAYTVDEGTANITLPYEPWATYQQEQDSIDEIFGTIYLVTESGVRLQTENDENIVLA